MDDVLRDLDTSNPDAIDAELADWDSLTGQWARNWCNGANGVTWRSGHLIGHGGKCERCGDTVSRKTKQEGWDDGN